MTLPLSYSRGSFPVHYCEIKNVPQGLKPSFGLTHGTAKAVPFVRDFCSPLADIKTVLQGLEERENSISTQSCKDGWKQAALQSSFSRPFGTGSCFIMYPGLASWAKFNRPCD